MKCAKVLYDQDVTDKMVEINSLKNENSLLTKMLGETIAPRILIRDHKEWHTIVNSTLKYIYEQVCNIQLHPNNMENNDLVDGLWKTEDRVCKFELLKNCLIKLGGNNAKQWACKITQDIISDLNSVINILKINEKYTATEINNFVYCFIHDKLCDRHTNSLLANIPHYNCTNCGEIYNDPYDSEDGGETFAINEKCHKCYI